MTDRELRYENVSARLRQLENSQSKWSSGVWLLLGIAIAMPFGVSAKLPPHTFAAGQTIDEAPFNEMFEDLYRTAPGAYCGQTPPRDGDMGGYLGAQEICEDACNGSETTHMCTGAEVVRYLAAGGDTAFLPLAAWISTGAASLTPGGAVINDCEGWRSIDPNAQGTLWGQTAASYASCDVPRPILCCD